MKIFEGDSSIQLYHKSMHPFLFINKRVDLLSDQYIASSWFFFCSNSAIFAAVRKFSLGFIVSLILFGIVTNGSDSLLDIVAIRFRRVVNQRKHLGFGIPGSSS